MSPNPPIRDSIRRALFLNIIAHPNLKRSSAINAVADFLSDKPDHLEELRLMIGSGLKKEYKKVKSEAGVAKVRWEKFLNKHHIVKRKPAVITLKHVQELRRDAMMKKYWDPEVFDVVLEGMAVKLSEGRGKEGVEEVVEEVGEISEKSREMEEEMKQEERKKNVANLSEKAPRGLNVNRSPSVVIMPNMVEKLESEDIGRLVNVLPWAYELPPPTIEKIEESKVEAMEEGHEKVEEFVGKIENLEFKADFSKFDIEKEKVLSTKTTLSRKEERALKREKLEKNAKWEREKISALLQQIKEGPPKEEHRPQPKIQNEVERNVPVLDIYKERTVVKRRSNPKLEELRAFAEEYQRMVINGEESSTISDVLVNIEHDPQQDILSSADVMGSFDTADEISKSCIFSHRVLSTHSPHLPQYAILGHRRPDDTSPSSSSLSNFFWSTIGNTKKQIIPTDQKLYINANHPWSAFICGLQGSGKSHTMSTLLESFLIQSPLVGELERPMSGLVFHYSQYNSHTFFQPCEAAFLSYPAPEFAKTHKGVPVTVIVSPSNYIAMKEAYSAIPGITVKKFAIHPEQLNVTSMLELMAMDKEAKQPLYMQAVQLLLRQMAERSDTFSWNEFKYELEDMKLTGQQRGPLQQRMSLLESFIDEQAGRGEDGRGLFNAEDGRLTIVDLSDPFVDENLACVLFNISMRIYLESNESCGKVIGVDEAHKYITASSPSSKIFTESLLSLIRQQRHFGVRVLISTQEPTIDPRLIDLSAATFIHRFTSPTWYNTLKKHITLGEEGEGRVMSRIAGLRTGEAVVSAPTAAVAGEDGMERLGGALLKVKIRKRLTWDGGRSIVGTMGRGGRIGEKSEVNESVGYGAEDKRSTM